MTINLKKKKNTKKYLKKFKLNQLNFYNTKFKNIFVIRYNNYNLKELIFLKKKIKKLNYNFIIVKKKININYFLFSKGSILIIYGHINNMNNILKNKIFKRLHIILLKNNINFYFEKKIKKLFFFFEKKNLNNFLINFFLIFLYYLRQIRYIK